MPPRSSVPDIGVIPDGLAVLWCPHCLYSVTMDADAWQDDPNWDATLQMAARHKHED
jgi:hypothetical protein